MALRLLAHGRAPITLESVLDERNVALFDPRMERSFEPTVNRLRMQDLSLAALDLLVLRDSRSDGFDDIDSDDVLATYLNDVPVRVLCGSHDSDHPAPTLRAPHWSKESALVLQPTDFRGPETEALLQRSTALHRHERCHYHLPSAKVHAAEFIRMADALQDATDLVRLSDWILPLLGDRCGLAADTGTLLGLMAVVRDEARRRFGWEVPLAALDAYPRGPDVVEALIDNFAVAAWTRLVFLISVNSTGSVARDVVERAPDAHIVALCETAIGGGEKAEAAAPAGGADVFLVHPVERWQLDAQRRCERCGDLDLLQVHPETYQVTADLRWIPQGFDHNRADDEKAFWAVADRTKAVSLHVDQPMSSGAREHVRHLSVGLDITALLTDQVFFERSQRELGDRYPRPDVVLIPKHAATDALRQLAESTWDSPVFAVALGALQDDARDAVCGAHHVLVMDDVVISAQTLFGLRTRIYDISQEQHRDIRVSAFVVVARPSSTDSWRHIRQRYMVVTDQGMKQGLHAVQEVLLPPPGVDACPWCRERVMLQRCIHRLTGESARLAVDRETILRRTPLPVPIGIDGVGANTHTEGSMVGDLGPTTAFAAAASHAQHLTDELDRSRGVGEIPIFDIELLVSAVFDAAVFGGILRTFDPRHVRNPTRESELAACLLGKSWEPRMLAELAIGAAERKLPIESVVRCIDEQADDELLAAMLRAVATRGRRP